MKIKSKSGQLVADWIQERVKDYFNTTGRVFPDTDKALHFISEENGEAASAWNTIDGDDWLRNNPDGHKETLSDFVDELGDIALMAIVTAMSVDANAIGAMIAKMERNESEVEIGNPWFPVDDLSDPTLVMDVDDDPADAEPCAECVWFFKCATVRDRCAAESCVAFMRRAGAPDDDPVPPQVTIGCQRTQVFDGTADLAWICETPRTLCGYREVQSSLSGDYPVCGHLDPTSTSPMVDDPDDVCDRLDKTEG